MKVLHETAVEVPGIGNPGGYQLPFTHVQSGPGFTVVHADPGGGGGGGGSGGGSVGGGGGGGPPGIGNPGGSQLPLKQVQSGPGFMSGSSMVAVVVADPAADLSVAAVGGGPPGIGNPGGSQLPLKQVQSGPGFTVGQFDGGGSGGGGGGSAGGSVGGGGAAAGPRGSGIRAATSCR